MTEHSQLIVFPGNNSESVAEARAMLSAVSKDASRASNPEHKRDLESLYDWLEENINSRLVGAK
ncbi:MULTISPECIES: hypothetical protein [Gammaproteobacteria]|uniref:Uncharacterized protein n=2 Tax=Gammaproteobacteria TaxID=1236 RepID=A0AAX3P0J9_9GAMM|nr:MULTISPECIES: hypothetical protein [Gammaproteobacteria]MDV0844444.1 hypothetical protein [Klebsiella quasipneumoniae subsp. quasipneumoniae]WED79201.1 hypothetical protein PYU98_24930 [Aeromonas allosaccharophila]